MRGVSLLRALVIASCTIVLASLAGGADASAPQSRRHAAVADTMLPNTAAAAVPRGADSTTDGADPRDTATWILFSVLVVLLGGLTIRMVRGFDDGEIFDRLDPDDMETQIPG